MKINWGTGTDLPRAAVWALLMTLAGAVSPAAAVEEYYLYAPVKQEAPRIPDNPADGILTGTVIVKKGDTLTKLSRKYSGRGAFFPQILLFNRIRNPDRIYVGDRLRVPVTRPSTLAVPAGEKKVEPAGESEAQPAAELRVQQAMPSKPAVDESGRRLFDKGVSTYNKGNYLRALDLFEKFLTTYPNSPLAADAALFRADCYLQLAGRRQPPK